MTVQVLTGETADQLAPTLYADGVVASTRAFQKQPMQPQRADPRARLLRAAPPHAGQPRLGGPDQPEEHAADGGHDPRGQTGLPGHLDPVGEDRIPLKDFQQIIDHPAQLGLPSYAKGIKGFPDSAVEGFLFPATYAITPHETALQILQAMVDRFNVEAQAINITAAAQAVHLSAYQLIIEAAWRRPRAAPFPTTRRSPPSSGTAKAGMTMGFDSVLFYGLNAYGINVNAQQEAVNNPYNDMTEHTGLPPTPIDNPGDAAIQGILHPTPGNWLYFLTVAGGKSEFSRTPLKGQ